MFTGIIEEIGILYTALDKGSKRYLTINCRKVTDILKIGDSLACNGICLTVTDFNAQQVTVEVMQETLYKTTAKSWKTGDKINLERALMMNGRLDGHLVQGHIDTVSDFLYQETAGETVYLWFKLPEEFRKLVVAQGSIAVNGVSLTIAKLESEKFAVALISHTLAETNLAKPGKTVNLEFDVVGKYILRSLENSEKTGITMEWLHENNF